jgi:hypothetical protein
MAQGDAAGVKGSNRILSHGAPLSRMMPNGCLGSPGFVLLFGLDRGFLMDVGLCKQEGASKVVAHLGIVRYHILGVGKGGRQS